MLFLIEIERHLQLIMREFLYTTDSLNIQECVDDLGILPFSILKIEELMIIPTVDEIKLCVWSVHPLKAPGLNDFLGILFFQILL